MGVRVEREGCPAIWGGRTQATSTSTGHHAGPAGFSAEPLGASVAQLLRQVLLTAGGGPELWTFWWTSLSWGVSQGSPLVCGPGRMEQMRCREEQCGGCRWGLLPACLPPSPESVDGGRWCSGAWGTEGENLILCYLWGVGTQLSVASGRPASGAAVLLPQACCLCSLPTARLHTEHSPSSEAGCGPPGPGEAQTLGLDLLFLGTPVGDGLLRMLERG